MITRLFLTNTYKHTEFELENNLFNARRIRIFSLITFVVELYMLISTFINPEFFQQLLISYRYHFIFFLSFSFLGFILSTLFLKGVIKNSRRVKYIMILAIVISLFWGASISYMDIQNGGTLVVYQAFLFLFTASVSIRPFHAISAIIISQVFIALLRFDYLVGGSLLNTTIFALFAWIISRQQYSNEFKHYAMNKELIRKNDELRIASITDHLSGLYNRLYLDEKIVEIWNKCYDEKRSFCIIMADINDFKHFNDQFGHMKGDIYLSEVANALKKFTKKNNGYAFRYGGDEFCLIFEDKDKEIAYDLQRKLDSTVFKFDKTKFKVSTSIGSISCIPDQRDKAWTVIDKADRALYINKGTLRRRASD